jgi:hypothetical protein
MITRGVWNKIKENKETPKVSTHERIVWTSAADVQDLMEEEVVGRKTVAPRTSRGE